MDTAHSKVSLQTITLSVFLIPYPSILNSQLSIQNEVTTMKHMKNVPVVSHTQISHDTYKLIVKDAELAAITVPGQFAQLKPAGALAPLLRRPISVADVDASAQTLTFIYRVIGLGTQALTQLPAGGMLDIIGPLGNGFSLNAKKALLVGGGVGIAPLIYLSRALCSGSTQVLLAGRSESELFWQPEFKNSCEKIHITTDDYTTGAATLFTLQIHRIATTSALATGYYSWRDQTFVALAS